MFQVFIPKKPASLTRRSQPNRLCADQSRSNKPFGLLLDSGNQMVGGAVLTLGGKDQLARFEQAILPHLDAAYNLARWLTRNEHDAQDMVQEASLRAFKFFDGFHGVDARAWLLTTVRNTCYTWLAQNSKCGPCSCVLAEYVLLCDGRGNGHAGRAGPEPPEGEGADQGLFLPGA